MVVAADALVRLGDIEMEIPIEETIAGLENIIPKDIVSGQVTEKTIRLKLDAIQLIQAQAREILGLQATICRLKSEHASSISRTRDEAMRIVAETRLERQVDDEARRIRDLGDD